MKLKEQFKREYRIWKAMRARCHSKCFSNSVYQKRGIKVCKRWDSFSLFMEDMGPCPNGYSIDRIDTYGNYCPENCRWASRDEQVRNRGKFNLIYSYNGETMCLKDWSKKLGLNYQTLHMRLKRHPEFTFKQLITYIDPRDEKILWENQYYTRQQLCEKYNIPLMNFYDRTHKGWSLEKILLTPVNHKI